MGLEGGIQMKPQREKEGTQGHNHQKLLTSWQVVQVHITVSQSCLHTLSCYHVIGWIVIWVNGQLNSCI